MLMIARGSAHTGHSCSGEAHKTVSLDLQVTQLFRLDYPMSKSSAGILHFCSSLEEFYFETS